MRKKTTIEKYESLAILFGMAFMSAIGIFLFLCGAFQLYLSEIGLLASAGYVLGISGVLFALLLVFNFSEHRAEMCTKEHAHI